ncbi:hypothetical protein AgCh_039401 [Apium graveolens]
MPTQHAQIMNSGSYTFSPNMADIGATNHTCCTLAHMHDVLQIETPFTVKFPNGEHAEDQLPMRALVLGNMIDGLYQFINLPSSSHVPSTSAPSAHSVSQTTPAPWHQRLVRIPSHVISKISILDSCDSPIDGPIFDKPLSSHIASPISSFPSRHNSPPDHVPSPSDMTPSTLQSIVPACVSLRHKVSHQWFEKLVAVLLNLGFIQTVADYSLFTLVQGDSFIITLVYVDDILLTEHAKTLSLPLDSAVKLSVDDGELLEDPSLYQKFVGKLLYLIVS